MTYASGLFIHMQSPYTSYQEFYVEKLELLYSGYTYTWPNPLSKIHASYWGNDDITKTV